jgi:hypothetical protein
LNMIPSSFRQIDCTGRLSWVWWRTVWALIFRSGKEKGVKWRKLQLSKLGTQSVVNPCCSWSKLIWIRLLRSFH